MQLCPFTVFSLFACLLVLKKTQTKSHSAQSQVILLIKTNTLHLILVWPQEHVTKQQRLVPFFGHSIFFISST